MVKKSAVQSPMKGNSPSKKDLHPAEKAKAYKAYYSTLDADQLRGMCKDGGHDTKGTKTELVERLSKGRGGGNRARSGSPLRKIAAFDGVTKNLTHGQESVFFGVLVVLVGILLVGGYLLYSVKGDFSKFLDLLGPVGKWLKGLGLGAAKGAASAAAAKASGK